MTTKMDWMHLRPDQEGHMLMTYSDYALCFKLRQRKVFEHSKEELDAFAAAFCRCIQHMKPGTLLVRQGFYWMDHWRPEADEPETGTDDPADATNGVFLDACNDRHFMGRRYLRQDDWLYFVRLPKGRNKSAGQALAAKHLVPRESLDDAAVQGFTREVELCVRILEEAGLGLTPLSVQDMVSTEQRVGLIEAYAQLEFSGKPPVLRDIAFKDDRIQIGDRTVIGYSLCDAGQLGDERSFCRVYKPVQGTEKPIYTSAASPLGIEARFNHILTTIIRVDDQTELFRTLERKAKRMLSLAAHSRAGKENQEAVLALMSEATRRQVPIVRMHHHMLAWTNNSAELERLRSDAAAAFARAGITPHMETVGLGTIWAAGMPGNAGDLPDAYSFLTLPETAVSLIPHEGGFHSADGGKGMRLCDRIDGAPVAVDLSDEPMRMGLIHNANKIMIGASGAGKSTVANHLIRHQFGQGAFCTVVDIGGSYEGLCSLVKGVYQRYDHEHPVAGNPFLPLRDGALGLENLEAILVALVIAWKGEGQPVSRSEHVALSEAVNQFRERMREDRRIVPCFDHFHDFLQGPYADQLNREKVRLQDFDLQNLLYTLRPFRKDGQYGMLLNAAEHQDIRTNRMRVLELDAIKDHPILLPMVVVLLLNDFMTLVRRHPGIRKLLVIDEAWKPLMRPVISEYVVSFYKTLRKHLGEPLLITQELGDLVGNPIIKEAVLNNSPCKIVLELGQSGKGFDELQQTLGFSDKDMALVQSLNKFRDPSLAYKEVFIALGQQSQVYRTEVSTEEYLTYTTSPREKLLVQEYARKHGGLQEGIVALAAAIRHGSVKLGAAGMGAIRQGSVKLGAAGATVLANGSENPGTGAIGHGAMKLVMMLVAALAAAISNGAMKLGVMVLVLWAALLGPHAGQAQWPIGIGGIIDGAVKRVIVATDLSILRMQTDAINAQDAQRLAENEMQTTELSGIAGEVQKIQALYQDYYAELWRVKTALTGYSRVAAIIRNEARLLGDYRQAWAALSRDGHFSAEELARLDRAYQQVLAACENDIRLLYRVITDGVTQMEDGGRLAMIDRIDEDVGQCRRDMERLTQDHILLSLQRSKDWQELQILKQFYGL